jgi:hypothetical protein
VTAHAKAEPPHPAHPLLIALAIPLCAVAMLAGGALGALRWMLLPSLLLSLGGGIGLLMAVIVSTSSSCLSRAGLMLLLAPLIATPLLGMRAAQDLVLQARGVTRSGVVTRVDVEHGRTTTYSCTVRYRGSAGARPDTVECGSDDRTGERVGVVHDPGGLVHPEFAGGVRAGRFEAVLAAWSAVALLAVSWLLVGVSALHRRLRRKPRLPAL